MKRIGLITSGGDAPGMNACIRAVVRAALHHGLEVIGFQSGYRGVLERDARPLDSRSVSNIIQRGGTILHTARSKRFRTEEGLKQAAENLEAAGIDALFVIGGDGSMRGCQALARHWDKPLLGLPGTIDNDMAGTDYTIGFHTALNTALDAIDKIRDTADAHERLFFVEVMGRHAGHIALHVGLAGGAEEILIPEAKESAPSVAERLLEGRRAGKTSSLVIVAEGAFPGGAPAAAEAIGKHAGMKYRVCVLGHVQRGGSPTASDRVLASKLGVFAVEAALEGHRDVLAGIINHTPTLTPLEETTSQKKPIDAYEKKVAEMLAT